MLAGIDYTKDKLLEDRIHYLGLKSGEELLIYYQISIH